MLGLHGCDNCVLDKSMNFKEVGLNFILDYYINILNTYYITYETPNNYKIRTSKYILRALKIHDVRKVLLHISC